MNWHSDVLLGADTIEDCSVPVDWDDVALNIGAEVIRSLRKEIYDQLRYTCSGGIAGNKVLAKLAAGRHKPNGQTVLRNSSIPFFLSSYKITKLRGLGGKLGQQVSTVFGTERLSDLLLVSLSVMQSKLGSESGQWVFRIIRGVDHSVVTPRTQIQSIMSQKTFTPRLNGPEQAERWLRIFAADIMGRLEDQEGRRPRTLTVNHNIKGRFGPTRSKQVAIPRGASLDLDCLVVLMKNVIQKISDEEPSWPCLALSVGVSNFEDTETASRSIMSFYKPVQGHAAAFEPIRPERMLEDEEVLDPPDSFEYEEESTPSTPEHQMGGASSPKPASDDEGMYPCPDCTKLVPARDVLEHLDWHVAKAFQNQP
jgi:DNA polymerase eta